MANITVRNIPDDIFKKIKTMSTLEKRSLNNEILVILEKGISKVLEDFHLTNRKLSKKVQLRIWHTLTGRWKDNRSTDKIISDIYSKRSKGRKVAL
jgi:plasmid stability protein